LEEQPEIVRQIESAFSKLDRLASEKGSAAALLDRLDRAILAKAFRGELVPQDPNDEPASVLLERVRASRAVCERKGTVTNGSSGGEGGIRNLGNFNRLSIISFFAPQTCPMSRGTSASIRPEVARHRS
jgi:hypothetical protein